VVLIIFVFLRNVRATIIPGLAIPASIIATFAVMYFLGFSINNLTLLALTLAIGIVVDDAIIVLENAYRHQEELHESPEVAATNGTREIVIAGMPWVLFNSLKREFIPADDQGWFMTATIAPEGSSLSFTDGYQKQVEQIISKVPEVESYFG